MNLLYKSDNEPHESLFEATFHDLALEELLAQISGDTDETEQIKKILMQLPTHLETIRYRQEILRDFMESRKLREGTAEILNKIKLLSDTNQSRFLFGETKSSIWQMIQVLRDMELYADIIVDFDRLLTEYPPKSEGLQAVAARIHETAVSQDIIEMREDIRKTRTEIDHTKSITLGVNLTSDLNVEQVFIKEFHEFHQRPPVDHLEEFVRTMNQLRGHEPPDHMMVDLTKQVEKHFGHMAKRIRNRLNKYINLDGSFLTELCDGLLFYIRVAAFGDRLAEDGYDFCFPHLKQTNTIRIKNIYNLRLALKKETEIVKNDFSFDEDGRVYILTGPNRGGKTILTQGIGLAAYMAACGMFVCASSYEGFCVRQIFTHFPADENRTISHGRLGEEAARIQSIVRHLDSNCLLLLNETYSTTCASDGLYLAKDFLRIIKERNAMTIYNTHIHELGLDTEQMNTWEGEAKIVSIIMEIKDNQNTFRVLREKPDVCSYARNVALKYGVTYEQMKELTNGEKI